MKFSLNIFGALAVLCAAFAVRAQLTPWAENVSATDRLENVFFRAIALPAGPVVVRKPPADTRADLSRLIAASPGDAELYSLRALEAEQQLDFAAAQADWQKYVEVSSDKGAARLAVADYFHRRLQSNDELTELAMAARENIPDAEKTLPPARQRRWRIYERAIRLIDEQRLDSARAAPLFRSWIQDYSREAAVYQDYFRFATSHKRYDMASEALAAYRSAFPGDEEFPIEAQAEIATASSPAQALQIYERNFRPLWPTALVAKYFALLKSSGQLRAYLATARAALAANPSDLDAAARLFYYWQQQGNAAAADRALIEFRERKKTSWAAEDLLTTARLFELSHNYDEAARNYYALYSAAGSDNAMAETALGSLARLLLSVPEQPMHFGAGNLSLYRDVATMDPHPGFLNGVASLLLNDTDPRDRYASEEQNAAPYFHRARGAELVALFESRFPQSAERAPLRERVIEAYSVYGANDGVIRAGTRFLADFPDAQNRAAVSLRMADAYARLNQTQQEFAMYDALLAELGKSAGGIPLGPLPPANSQPNAPQNAPSYDGLRSPEYARVLDRYVARLVSLKRVLDALALYRREIDRNPNDPGLYDTLAAFLDQNRLGGEMEQVYQRAIAQFPDHTWEHKLARWYLRQRRQADVARLTRDVVNTFSGTELANYFREIVNPAAPVGPALYLQLNLYAHQRFPHQLTFVRNLLNAYSASASRNDAAYETLLRQNWYNADDLRMRFFERLSRTGRLSAELARLGHADPRFTAEGEAWRGHFETAAPLMLAIEKQFPADPVIGARAAAMERSLDRTDAAIAVEENLSRANPRDAATLTSLGDIEAGRDRFLRAAEDWNRIPEIEPSKADSYIQAATVFWDYYRYDDALRLIRLARTRLGDGSLFAYEAGAIYENQRAYDFAIREYARGAIAQPGSNAERRLLSLARRPELSGDIEQLTANLVSSRDPQMGAFRLRLALLRNQGRRADLEKFLAGLAARAISPELLAAIETEARSDRLPDAQQAALERQIAVTSDPVERMQLRLSLARFFEGQGKLADGARTVDALYRENPAILGIVRAAVDYHWRTKDARRAVDVLAEAAARASDPFRAQFTVEAARRANESGDYARARGFAATLLATDPDRAEYIAIMADSYAREGDDRGLRAFYEAKLRAFGAGRGEQASAMRRALIPVLTHMKDFSGAVDQYIEILNRYPEDAALAREAAQYASEHALGGRLRDFYSKAANDSPKDFRWPMVLARIETQLEDFPSAIGSYTRAAAVRPDRVDLLEARINLEMRLLRFDEAAATATKLYDLTYRNPHWMEQLAEIRARQGRASDAVEALRKAWIDGRSDNAQNLARIAEQLEQWGLFPEAAPFAEEAWKRSPDDGLRVYARLKMHARQFDAALDAIAAASDAAAESAIPDAGVVVAQFYSPREKTQFAAALEKRQRRIEMAEASGLADVEATWRFEELRADPAAEDAPQKRQRLVELQQQRAAFNELGTQMEALDRAPGSKHSGELIEAAEAYRAGGNAAAELRVSQLQNQRAALQGPMLDRYGALLAAQPQRLTAAIAREPRSAVADALVNYAVDHGTARMAQRAVAARGVKNGPLWTKAYTALAAVYFANASAPAKAAFADLLGNMTIGARIGQAFDRDRQLAGDLWFYYAGRYGEFARDEDDLPAMLEASPGRSDAYFELAEFLRGIGENARASEEYRRALELDPVRGDAHDRLAMLAAKAGRNDEAVKEWKLAIAGDLAAMNRVRVPQNFWGDVSDALHHIGEAKLLAPVRGDIENLLRVYIHRNGSFQVASLLEAAIAAGGDTAWIVDMSRSAPDPAVFLANIIDQPWVGDDQKDLLFARIVETLATQMTGEPGDRQSELASWRIRWAEYLLDRKDEVRAARVVADLGDARKSRAAEVIPLELRLAAREGTLATRLASYENPVPIQTLQSAATDLAHDGDAVSARRVMEFAYERELRGGNTDLSMLLGLAGIRLEENRIDDALVLLRRAALISGEPFSALDPAAALLESTGHRAQAIEFLTALVKAEPWNRDARERLAAAQSSTDALAAVAKSSDAPYASRVAAARALRTIQAPPLTETEPELMLLASQNAISEADATQPYFFAARMDARGSRERLLGDAVAVDPKNEAAKVALFHAALAARHDALALAIAGSFVSRYIFDSEYSTWVADGFLSNMVKTDREAIARGLGDASERTGNFRAALLFYQIAQRIAPSGDASRALETARHRSQADAANEQRRPVVTDHLDQDRLVRARITP